MRPSRRSATGRVVVFVAMTWLLLGALGAAQQFSGGVPAEVVLPQLAPGLAALIMLITFRRDSPRVSFTLGSRPARRVLLAVGAPLVVALVAAFVVAPVSPELALVPLAVAWIPVGAFAEELGWRGYLNPVIATRLRGLSAAIITGMLWAPFHVGLWGLGPLRFGLFAVGLVGASVVVVALVGDARYSVTLATLFHIAINVGSALLGQEAVSIEVLGVSALAWTIAAAIAVLVRRRLFLDPVAARASGEQPVAA